MLANLASRSAVEVSRIAAWLEAPTDQIAWATQNLYELNLRVRRLLRDARNIDRFRSEMVSDQIQLLEGLSKLFEFSKPDHKAALQEGIKFRRDQLEKDGVPEVKQLTAAELARQLGATDEHQRFYKLYLKYVHASSAYLVNSGQEFFDIFDRYSRTILFLNAQQYARDTIELVTPKTNTSLDSLTNG